MISARRTRVAVGTALAAAALASSGCSARPTEPAATPGTPSPTVAESTTPPTATTAPLSVAMRQWEAKAGEHFTASGEALAQVSEASEAGDEAALQSGCRQLHDANTVGLQRDLPTPDPRLTEKLQRMIDDVNTATHACVRFVLARDAVDASVYRDYLARAVEHLNQAKAILNEDLAPK